MSNRSNHWISLRSAQLSAQVDPFGAQLSVLQDQAGRDLLWNGDPSVWSGRAPLLFPIVGNLAGGRYRVGSKTYQLPRHGFARTTAFETLGTTANSAIFRLQANDATLAVYPFRFELDVRFALSESTLSVTMSARNTGAEDLYASFGYHPALRWPLPYGQARASHFIEFANDEPAPIRRLDAGGLLRPGEFPTPVSNRRLVLRDELFASDVIIFDRLHSRSVLFGAESGPNIRISYPDATYLGVWTKPGAPFICIEPWQGVADPEGFSGELSEKPGVFSVAPGEERALRMEIALSNPGAGFPAPAAATQQSRKWP